MSTKYNSDVLYLTLHKKWFDKIASGRKTHEFREVKPYWIKRLEGRTYSIIIFKNGYAAHMPTMRVEFLTITRRTIKVSPFLLFTWVKYCYHPTLDRQTIGKKRPRVLVIQFQTKYRTNHGTYPSP